MDGLPGQQDNFLIGTRALLHYVWLSVSCARELEGRARNDVTSHAGAPRGWTANANQNALSLDCAKRSILQRKLTDQTGVTGHSQCLQFGK